MTNRTLTLAAILALAIAGAASAQTTDAGMAETPPAATETPAPADAAGAEAAPAEGAPAADDLSLGQPADDGIGSTYVVTKHGDWEQRCVRTADGADPCQAYQLMRDAEGNPVSEISIFGLPEGGQAVAGATIVVPLETLLTQNLTLQIDTGAAKKYPFTWCAPIGCIARVGFTGEELAALKKGANASVTIVPVIAPDRKVTVTASLKGFTAAYDAVAATTPKAPEAAPAAEGGN
jgi:invasion protein IalB